MARVKRGVIKQQSHKAVLGLTKGHRGPRHKLYRRAHESLIHALYYSYAHRRERKGDMRRLWILRINAAAHANGLTYSRLIHGLNQLGAGIDRKMLAYMALRDPDGFARIVSQVKEQASPTPQ